MSAQSKKKVDDYFKTGKDVKVVFMKKDGSLRTMVCTTNLAKIPAVSHPKGERTPNEETKAVWDLEKGAWRSFRYDSVITFEEHVA